MKTILVVYTNTKITNRDQIQKSRKYSFNTEENIEVGKLIETPSYTQKLQVVDVFEKSFKYVIPTTGELTNEINNTNAVKLRFLKIIEPTNDNDDIVIGSIVKDE